MKGKTPITGRTRSGYKFVPARNPISRKNHGKAPAIAKVQLVENSGKEDESGDGDSSEEKK